MGHGAGREPSQPRRFPLTARAPVVPHSRRARTGWWKPTPPQRDPVIGRDSVFDRGLARKIRERGEHHAVFRGAPASLLGHRGLVQLGWPRRRTDPKHRIGRCQPNDLTHDHETSPAAASLHPAPWSCNAQRALREPRARSAGPRRAIWPPPPALTGASRRAALRLRAAAFVPQSGARQSSSVTRGQPDSHSMRRMPSRKSPFALAS